MRFYWTVRYISTTSGFKEETVPSEFIDDYLNNVISSGVYEESIKMYPDLNNCTHSEENILGLIKSTYPDTLRYVKCGLI